MQVNSYNKFLDLFILDYIILKKILLSVGK